MPAHKGNQYAKRDNPFTEQIGIRLTPEMARLYRQVARDCGKTLTEVIRDSVEHQIHEQKIRGWEFFTCEGRAKLAHFLKREAEITK